MQTVWCYSFHYQQCPILLLSTIEMNCWWLYMSEINCVSRPRAGYLVTLFYSIYLLLLMSNFSVKATWMGSSLLCTSSIERRWNPLKAIWTCFLKWLEQEPIKSPKSMEIKMYFPLCAKVKLIHKPERHVLWVVNGSDGQSEQPIELLAK